MLENLKADHHKTKNPLYSHLSFVTTIRWGSHRTLKEAKHQHEQRRDTQVEKLLPPTFRDGLGIWGCRLFQCAGVTFPATRLLGRHFLLPVRELTV